MVNKSIKVEIIIFAATTSKTIDNKLGGFLLLLCFQFREHFLNQRNRAIIIGISCYSQHFLLRNGKRLGNSKQHFYRWILALATFNPMHFRMANTGFLS
nr:MAG TPA: hypothetical protein [Caudoviricetes sp.]